MDGWPAGGERRCCASPACDLAIAGENLTARNMHPRRPMGTIESSVEKNVAKMEQQLKIWNAKLAELIARGKIAGQEAKADSRKALYELKAKVEVAQSKVAQLR